MAVDKSKTIKSQMRKLLKQISSERDAHDIWASFMQVLPNPDTMLTVAGADKVAFYY